MDWYVRAFLKASLAWLALGVTLGVAMAVHPAWTIYRLAHVHMMLLGFVTMMIFGVAYHVIPRFAGFPLHSRRAAVWHWWIANVGLLIMVAGFTLRVHNPQYGSIVLASGGTLSALGAYLFAYVLWHTIDGPKSMRAATRKARAAAASQPGAPVTLASVTRR